MEKGRIVQTGMGGFLNPPTHPEHTLSVEIDLRRKPENRGRMSLSAAANCDWLDDSIRGQACLLLRKWEQNKPEIDTNWIFLVLGYFRNCYVGMCPEHLWTDCHDGKEWHVENLRVNNIANPLLNDNLHAGVHHIRKYYPDYKPTKEHFDGAFWGDIRTIDCRR